MGQVLGVNVIYGGAAVRLIPLSPNCRCQALWWAIISLECLNLFHWGTVSRGMCHYNSWGSKKAKKWYKTPNEYKAARDGRMIVMNKDTTTTPPPRFLIFLFFPCPLMNFFCILFVRSSTKRRTTAQCGWGQKLYLCQNVGILLGFPWMANMASTWSGCKWKATGEVVLCGGFAEVEGLTALVTV